MEPTVRDPRIESAIGSEARFSATIPERWLVSSVPKFSRGERNFWMQRREAKNPPERPLLAAETGNSKIGVKNPRRNGLFLIGDGCAVSSLSHRRAWALHRMAWPSVLQTCCTSPALKPLWLTITCSRTERR
jgi:hypothetical protein